MAETKSRSRGSGSSSRATGKRTAATKRSTNTRTRARAASSRASSNGAVESVKSGAGSAVGAVGAVGKFAFKNVAVPAAAALAGTAAGMAMGRRRVKMRKKVLGVPIPGTSASGVDGLARNVSEAGKQFGKLAGEIRKTREKAEEIGKAVS